MNLEGCTPAQRASIRHVDGPLFIAAGAGSGKTFTLQQRIVYALLPESGPACSSLDEVLAITFMEKAAGEIKSRVRSALRAEGMVEQALAVDAAWISTIHGMCSRILRENSFAAGIDPGFEMLSGLEGRRLRDEALDVVLRREAQHDRYKGLFAEYGAQRGGPQAGVDVSVQGMLDRLLDKASSYAEGLDAVDKGPAAPSVPAIARELLEAYEEGLAFLEGAMGKKPGKLQLKSQAICSQAARALQGFLAGGSSDLGKLADVLGEIGALGFPQKNGFGGKDKEGGAMLAVRIRTTFTRACDNVEAALARPHAHALLELARAVEDEYQRQLDARGVLGNDELLRRTLELLQRRPEVAQSYRRRFKLVMVDEFQDTNQLQVDLIGLVAGFDHLCTVGDAQQSIYRFNGADVEVFRAQEARVAADGTGRALMQRLDDNFRSHGDVLAFVRRVCGQPQVFGEGFLDLRASRRERGAYRGRGPRVEVQLCTYKGSKADTGVVQAQAAGIAARFAELRAAGHGAGEMVVLLSAMTEADVYAQALRDQGFSCVLSGGRSFYDTEEVQTVKCVLAALADPADTEALFAALSSDLVQLSASDFLRLGTMVDASDGRLRIRTIDRGMREEGLRTATCAGGAGEASPALTFALELFDRARRRMTSQRPSEVLMGVLSESGWLARLESQGTEGVSRAANILKAVRAVEELQARPGSGFAQVARDFRDMVGQEKEGPGSLSVSDQNAVRIMTIHKSKGLEFPIVAVAGCEPQVTRAGSFLCDSVGGKVRMALSAKRGQVNRPSGCSMDALAPGDLLRDGGSLGTGKDGRRSELVDQARDAACFAEALRRRANDEELAEARRKFYVACTRASEYLLVCGLTAQTKEPLDGYRRTPVLDDVRQALMGDADFPEGEALLDCGGSEPLLFTRRFLAAEDAESVEDAGDAGAADGGGAAGASDTCVEDGADSRDGADGRGEGPAEGVAAGFDGPGGAGRTRSALGDGSPDGACRRGDERSEGGRRDDESFLVVPVLPAALAPTCVPIASPARAGMFSYTSLAAGHAEGGPDAEGDVSLGGPVPQVPARSQTPCSAFAPDGGMGAEGAGDLSFGPWQGPEAPAGDAPASDASAHLGASGEGPVPAATDLGEAFHRVAQAAVLRRDAEGCLRLPPEDRVTAIARRQGAATGSARARLDAALARWFSSEVCARADAHEVVRAEVPFLAHIDCDGEDCLLEGEIDLLACDGAAGGAFVVDYKTGGHDRETPDQLQEKHRLQAICYAYALLSAGFKELEFAFVRVERPDPSNPEQPQVVSYRFTMADLPTLRDVIQMARRRAPASS